MGVTALYSIGLFRHWSIMQKCLLSGHTVCSATWLVDLLPRRRARSWKACEMLYLLVDLYSMYGYFRYALNTWTTLKLAEVHNSASQTFESAISSTEYSKLWYILYDKNYCISLMYATVFCETIVNWWLVNSIRF